MSHEEDEIIMKIFLFSYYMRYLEAMQRQPTWKHTDST